MISKRYFYEVTILKDAEPTVHKFYCNENCTPKKARKYFENKGYIVYDISRLCEEVMVR